MRATNRLSSQFLKSAPVGKHCDGAGLWLVKREDGGAQWVLRVTVHGRRREMGLGGFPALSLADARKQADRWRKLAASGRDPVKEREAERRAARREDISLAILTADAFEARKAELKGDGTAGRWLSPLNIHVLPKLGRVPVTDLDQRDIRDTLAPIWHTKADTARKALNRLSIVLRHAAALGLDVDLQATDKAKALLGKSRHVPKNIPAMSWADVPGFYASLEEPTLTHLALRLLILTGVRSGPLRNIRLDQIEGDVWTVPAEAMKGRKGATDDFRVPLSDEAQRIIDLARPLARNGFLFPNTRGGVISDMTLSRHMERRGLEARPHGFRTSLRTWLAEATDAPHEVAEAMLAHVVDGGAGRALGRPSDGRRWTSGEAGGGDVMMSEDDRVNANVLIREIFSREVLRADIESNPSDGEQMVNALRKALENPDTNDFDAGVEVAADMLLGGQLLPDWLATFAAGVLRGELKRPTKRGPDKYTNWIRDYTIARAVVEVSERFGLPKYTNNELSYKVTASQIVAETTHFSIEVVHHAVKNFGGRIKSETLPQVSTD